MNAIVAVYSDWGIGYNCRQTTVIPEDREFFKDMTSGGVIIAGRKTFEGFAGPLLNRKNIVLTHNRSYISDGAVTANTVEDVLAEITGVSADMVFVVGGGEVFRLFLPRCTFAYVTKIEASPTSDTFFPDLDALPGWQIDKQAGANEYRGILYSFCIYRNLSPKP